jgi:4-amino-4-deoxy-L-arabinose transferase-like glycosyltransferase
MKSDNPVIEESEKLMTAGKTTQREKESQLSASSILLSAAAGLTLIFLAVSSDYFWNDAKTFLNAEFCLPLAAGFALALLGSLLNTRWSSFAGWTALALTGQAASLQMIDAGRLIHFQHYRSLGELLDKDVLSLIFFALQISLVAIGISRRVSIIKAWFTRTFKVWQLILAGLFLLFSGAAVTPDFSIYTTSILIAAIVQAVNLANIILLVWSVPEESLEWLKRKVESFFSESKLQKSSLDGFSLLAALWTISLCATLSYFVYENHPHVPDETQYLFQAKYLAAGQLTVKAPPVPEAFAIYMTPEREARWFGIFPPAFPAMLAIGEKLGAIWLVNPILAGLCVLLAYLFFQEIYSRSFARIAVLLLCCSPWFIFLAMSFMSHVFTLACALSAAVLLSRAIRNQKFIYVVGAGLFAGIVYLTRPLDGVMVAVLLGVWTLFGFPTWKAKITNASVLAGATLATAALIFPYNSAVTGSATLSPSDAYYTNYFPEGVMTLGFGANRGFHWGLDAFPGHSPLEAVVNAALNTFLLNTELFGWGCGSLIVIVAFTFAGALQKKDFWAFAVIAVVVFGYSFFWYHGGPDFGARYWFLTIIPLVALTVRAIEWLGQIIAENDVETRLNPRVILAAAMLCALSLTVYIPWRSLDKYHHYLEMQPDILELARRNDFKKSLVLIRGEEHPDYQSAWIYNPLNYEGDAPIYAWGKNAEVRRQLLQVYADRQVWTVDGPTRTGSGYQIVGGAVEAKELLAEETSQNRLR